MDIDHSILPKEPDLAHGGTLADHENEISIFLAMRVFLRESYSLNEVIDRVEYYRFVVRKQKWLVWFGDLVYKHVFRQKILGSYSKDDREHMMKYLVANHKVSRTDVGPSLPSFVLSSYVLLSLNVASDCPTHKHVLVQHLIDRKSILHDKNFKEFLRKEEGAEVAELTAFDSKSNDIMS